jgi:hypothetical protein
MIAKVPSGTEVAAARGKYECDESDDRCGPDSPARHGL